MRISATGTAERGFTPSWRSAEHGFTPSWRSAEHGFTPSWRSAEHGFTLIELLAVLTIIGLASAAAVLAFPDPRGSLAGEAERFAARARAAQERAIMDNRPVGVRVTRQGYKFEWAAGGEWRPLEQKPFTPVEWKPGTEPVPEAARLVFDPTGSADVLRLELTREGEAVAIEIGEGGGIHVRH